MDVSARSGASAALILEGVSKRFGGTQALADVGLVVAGGEVHVLLGENGSGKSTLVKILSGYYAPDCCTTFSVHGHPLPLPTSPSMLRINGVGFLHQELGLIPGLSVTENVFLTRIAESGWGRCRWQEMSDRAEMLLTGLGISIDPSTLVEELGQGDRALVALSRSLMELELATDGRGSVDSRLLVLDEPTAFLDASEVERVWGLLRRLRDGGHSVLMVLHDLDEALRIADRITVLRDGRVAGRRVSSEVSVGELTELILGRTRPEVAVGQKLAVARTTPAAVSLEGKPRNAGRGVHLEVMLGPSADLFELDGGEVVGLTGLRGGRWEHLPYRLFGLGEGVRGTLKAAGDSFELASLSPRRAIQLGMALIPADRLGAACFENLSLAENLVSLLLPGVMRGRFVSERRSKAAALEQLMRFDIRPQQLGLQLGFFSGGNQQKAVLARWFQTKPLVLLLHEPTQGVDVGARVQVHAAIVQLAISGAAVLLASSDHGELAEVCNRILVMRRDGQLLEMAGQTISEAAITEACISGTVPGKTGSVHE